MPFEGSTKDKKLKTIFLVLSFIFFLVIVILVLYLNKYVSIAGQTEGTILGRIEKAVTAATAQKESDVRTAYEKKIAEDNANPWKAYRTEDIFGAFAFNFPKDWYVSITKNIARTDQFVFLADPNWIIHDSSQKGPFTNLRIQVINHKYDWEVNQYESKNKFLKQFDLQDSSLGGIQGKRITWTGDDSGKKTVAVILPYRDKVLYVGSDKYDEIGGTFEDILKSFVLNK